MNPLVLKLQPPPCLSRYVIRVSGQAGVSLQISRPACALECRGIVCSHLTALAATLPSEIAGGRAGGQVL